MKHEESYIKALLSEHTIHEICKILDLWPSQVSRLRKKYGIKCSPQKSKEKEIEGARTGAIRLRELYTFIGEHNPNWKGGISYNNSYHYKKIQAKRYPERIKAREKVHNAIKSGKLIRLPCEKCGETQSHAHHEDYSKPLDVKWFCRKHHREVHGGKH